MESMEVWKCLTDVLLLLALGYLCYQFVRSPRMNAHLKTVRELEVALRALVREADGAGRSLNTQLMQRQQALEKVIIDSELAAQRIEQGIQGSASRTTAGAALNAVSMSETVEVAHGETDVAFERAAQRRAALMANRPIAPAGEQGDSTLRSAIEVSVSDRPATMQSKPRLNIYGEPIETNASATEKVAANTKQREQLTYTPRSISRARPAPPAASHEPEQPQTYNAIDTVYAMAEALLRAGEGLAVVAARTNLPMNDIRALSQMIVGERAVASARADGEIQIEEGEDPRLGVLATMKRQTITV